MNIDEIPIWDVIFVIQFFNFYTIPSTLNYSSLLELGINN